MENPIILNMSLGASLLGKDNAYDDSMRRMKDFGVVWTDYKKNVLNQVSATNGDRHY